MSTKETPSPATMARAQRAQASMAQLVKSRDKPRVGISPEAQLAEIAQAAATVSQEDIDRFIEGGDLPSDAIAPEAESLPAPTQDATQEGENVANSGDGFVSRVNRMFEDLKNED